MWPPRPERQSGDRARGKSVAVKRLRRLLREIGMIHQLGQRRLVDLSGQSAGAVLIHRAARLRKHQVVEQGVARPGVAGDGVGVGLDISHVGDPADIDEQQRRARPRPPPARDDRPAPTARPARLRPCRRREVMPRDADAAFASAAASPICTVSLRSGRCSTVWP